METVFRFMETFFIFFRAHFRKLPHKNIEYRNFKNFCKNDFLREHQFELRKGIICKFKDNQCDILRIRWRLSTILEINKSVWSVWSNVFWYVNSIHYALRYNKSLKNFLRTKQMVQKTVLFFVSWAPTHRVC